MISEVKEVKTVDTLGRKDGEVMIRRQKGSFLGSSHNIALPWVVVMQMCLLCVN